MATFINHRSRDSKMLKLWGVIQPLSLSEFLIIFFGKRFTTFIKFYDPEKFQHHCWRLQAADTTEPALTSHMCTAARKCLRRAPSPMAKMKLKPSSALCSSSCLSAGWRPGTPLFSNLSGKGFVLDLWKSGTLDKGNSSSSSSPYKLRP
jgi:hypothetical protein